MSTNNEQRNVATVFISYAREDKQFVKDLVIKLRERGIEAKGDWLLTTGDDYVKRLREFNLSTHAFIFVISPDSINSDACLSELALAVEHKKQILPISRRDHQQDNLLDSALRAPQWTFLREGDDVEHGMDNLVAAINTDFALMDMHGRLLVAADNWENNGRNRSYLLRKDGLKNAEGWLTMTSVQPDKLPQPTPLEVEFILASQRARTRGNRVGIGIAMSVILALAILSVVAMAQRSNALEKEAQAQTQEKIAKANEQEAKRQETEALRQQKLAEDNFREAEKQRKQAVDNAAEAKRQQAEAERQKKQAEDNLAEANRQKAEAVKQTGIANEQRQEAENRGRRLQKSYSETDYRAGNQLILNGDYAGGVAYLARALNTNPENSSAADRLFSLLAIKDQPLLQRRITPQSGALAAFDVSADGKVVATTSDTGEVTLWKEDNQAVNLDLQGHKAQTLRFIPKSNSLIITANDGALLLYTNADLKPIVRQLPSPISQYALNTTSDKLVAACEDGTFFMVPLNDGGPVEKLPLPLRKNVKSISFVRGDRKLAIIGGGGYLTWEFEESKVEDSGAFDDDLRNVDLAAVHRDGTYCFTFMRGGGLQETPYIDVEFEANETSGWKNIQYDFARAIDLDFSSNSRQLAVTLDNNEVHILSPGAKDLSFRHDGVTSVGFHPDKALLYTISRNGSVNLWSTSTGKQITAPLLHQKAVTDATFASSGDFLVTRTDDGTLNLWDVRQRTLTSASVEMEASKVSNFWVSDMRNGAEKRDRVGRFVLTTPRMTTYQIEEGVAVWQLLKAADMKPFLTYRQEIPEETLKIRDEVDIVYGFFPDPEAAISGNGNTVVTIAGNAPALVWHTDSDKAVLELRPTQEKAAFADEIYLTRQGDKALILYYRLAGGRKARSFYEIFSLSDGKSLAKVNLQKNQSLLTVSQNLDKVIIAHGESASVRDAYDFHLIGQEVRHNDLVASARFSNDEKAFGTGSYDATFRLWDTATGFPLSEPLIFDEDPQWEKGGADQYVTTIYKLVFTDDGKHFAVVDGAETGADGLTKLIMRTWDISIAADEKEAKRLTELATQIYGAKLNENGAIISLPQLSVTELGESFAKDKELERDLGKLIKWVLTSRAARPATPYSNH